FLPPVGLFFASMSRKVWLLCFDREFFCAIALIPFRAPYLRICLLRQPAQLRQSNTAFLPISDGAQSGVSSNWSVHAQKAITSARLRRQLHPRLVSWFADTFADFSHAQLLCVPAVLDRRSV